MDRLFRITNVSGGRGLVRTPIPFGASSSLPPGTPLGRRRSQAKRGRHTAIVSERALRPLVGFVRSGQLRVEALDGEPLPGWIFGKDLPVPEAPSVKEEIPEALEEAPAEEAPAEEAEETQGILQEGILDKPAKEILDFVKESMDSDLLCELHQVESDGKMRKTVLAALESRVGELE